MTALRIAVLDDYQGVAAGVDWSAVPAPVDVHAFRHHIDDPDELAAALRPFDVVVAMRERTPLDAALFARLPDLRLVVTTGPRNAVIDVGAAAARGVVVSGTGGYVTPTSELTWALILAVQRHVPAEDAAIRAGGWQHTIGRELAGRTLGLVGLGRIGALVAEVGRAFRMDVVAWSQNLTDERAAEVGVRRVAKDELFARSDVVSIHLVLSDRTRGLVGEAELAAMKPTAILVNTSRGPIVDEAALVRALHEGRIAGAGLDVFDREPLPADHPLRSAPRTVLTPHIGYVTDGLYEQFFREIVEDVAAFAAGAPIRVIEP
ncbi:MAG TPA: D-2-hydroxyacid dehydrogenase family protein [Acidimicrobiales bacterium]